MIVEQPKRFRKALKACEDAGFTFEARDFYKKEVYPDAPKDLKPYLLAKNFSFTYNSFDMSRIASSTIIDEMKLAFDIAREQVFARASFQARLHPTYRAF